MLKKKIYRGVFDGTLRDGTLRVFDGTLRVFDSMS